MSHDARIHGGKFTTKKRFALCAKTEPENVTLRDHSVVSNGFTGYLNHAPDGVYYVCGPDAATDRRWYATVTVSKGKVAVK